MSQYSNRVEHYINSLKNGTLTGDERTELIQFLQQVQHRQEAHPHPANSVEEEEVSPAESLLYRTYLQARIGTWELDVSTRQLYWSPITKELHEVDPGFNPDIKTAMSFYENPEHHNALEDAYDNAGKQGEPFDLELQITTATGNTRWIRIIGEPEFRDGECVRIFGSTQDIDKRKKAEEESEQYKRLLESIVNQTDSLVLVKDRSSHYLMVNQKMAELFGMDRRELIGKTPEEVFDPEAARQSRRQDQQVIQTGKPIFDKKWMKTLTGYRYYFSNKFPLTDVPGMEEAIGSIVTDITSFKEAEQRAIIQREAITYLATDQQLAGEDLEAKLKIIAQISAETLDVEEVHIWLFEDEVMRCVCSYDSGAINEFAGYEIPVENFPNYYKALQRSRVIAVNDVGKDDRMNDSVTEGLLRERGIRAMLDNSVLLSGRLIGLVGHNQKGQTREWEQDEIMFAEAISDQVAQVFADEERRKREQEVRESLKEKETLLTEIHHRVKNNLAVVSSMMHMQAYKADEEEVRRKLLDGVLRIRVMASIHDQLYQANSFYKLNFTDHLKLLVSNIIETMKTDVSVETEFNCEEVQLNVNQAIPCTLIINEVLTNSLKYAFPDRSKGRISIGIFEESRRVTVELSDDGIGLPGNFEELKKNSMGIKITEVLSQQLEADYEYGPVETGTRFVLRFDKSEARGLS